MSSAPKTAGELLDVLAEKEDMIQELTNRLEDIAEKYDRLQRMGADRLAGTGRPGGGASLSEELNQKLDDLRELFGEERPYDQLCRIEDRLELIFERIQSGGIGGGSGTGSSPGSSASTHSHASPANKISSSSGSETWQQARARIMEDSTSSPPPAGGPGAATVSAVVATPTAAPEVPDILEEAPPPAPVGPEATAEEILKGLDQRDQYIKYLISRTRQAEQRSFPQDWDLLAQVPEDLKNALDEVRAKLEKQLREAEVSNAIERAALGRERAKLFQIKQQLEQHIRRMSGGSTPEAAEESRTARLLGKPS